MKIFAVVVWYHPRLEYVKNLNTYSGFVDGVIIVDNSSFENTGLLLGLSNIDYVCELENKGVAKALNIGFQRAVEQGAEWVLTMDQDSSFTPGEIEKLLFRVSQVAPDRRVAIVAPRTQAMSSTALIDECDSVITSGGIVNALAYTEIGGYNDDMFIDEVDHEFGYRLKRAGHRILRINDVIMNHTVGEPFSVNFLWRKVNTTNHGCVRKYYMTRSRLYMRKNFSEFESPYLKMIVLDFIKVILVEKDKIKKIKYMLKGVLDHFRGVGGRLA